MTRRAGAGGFSLIEVLAAMVIFSAGAVILFGWIAQTADRLGRLGAEQQSLFGELTGLEFIRTLNPMQRPEGEITIGNVKVRWAAKAVGDESAVVSGGSQGGYIVRLYEVALTTTVGTAAEAARSVHLAGWRERSFAAASPSFENQLRNAPGSNAPAPSPAPPNATPRP